MNKTSEGIKKKKLEQKKKGAATAGTQNTPKRELDMWKNYSNSPNGSHGKKPSNPGTLPRTKKARKEKGRGGSGVTPKGGGKKLWPGVLGSGGKVWGAICLKSTFKD